MGDIWLVLALNTMGIIKVPPAIFRGATRCETLTKVSTQHMGRHHGKKHAEIINIAPETWWLEGYFPIGKGTFQGLYYVW